MSTHTLPSDLPEPADDGAASHLPGGQVPDVSLQTSSGDNLNLSTLPGRTVVYIYPMSGEDDSLLPNNWDAIPGARGCTPQHCNIRDHHQQLNELGVEVFGLATQSPAYLREEVKRLHLPYPLLSDENLELTTALKLPTLEVKVGDMSVLRRMTLVIRNRTIEKVFYPVFPPNRAAEDVIAWLHSDDS